MTTKAVHSGATPAHSDYAMQVLFALRQIVRSLDLHSRHLAKSIGLTGPQLVVLYEIFLYGSLPVGRLANLVSLSQATVTSIVDRLESKGLVVRTRSTKDRRVVFLSLTQEAQTYLRGRPSILHREFIEKFNKLDSWEQHMLLGAVERIAEMIKPTGIDPNALADSNEAPG